jgi:hypothetical protein
LGTCAGVGSVGWACSSPGQYWCSAAAGQYPAGTWLGLDVNLFPQRREVNRGWSDEGKLFRKMERYAAEHPGTFCFARPICRDLSRRPIIPKYWRAEAELHVVGEPLLQRVGGRPTSE